MAKSIHRLTVEIRRIETLQGDIRLIEFADQDDWELPPFTAGAHVDIHLPSGRIRQYSLCGDPEISNRYTIAVARNDAGRGGSCEVHDSLTVGQKLLLSLPRNHFPLVSEGRVVMVAGGIGLTPFLSMLPELRRDHREFEIHICNRNPSRHGFSSVLEGVPNQYTYYSEEGSRLDMRALINALGPEDHLYVCGPGAMMDEAQDLGGCLGDRLHLERFGAVSAGGQTSYEVELARRGDIVPVGVGETMLDALRNAEVEVPSSCEAGVCLDCKVRYLSGTPEHRDLALSKSDRNSYLTPCVSGCAGGRIVLDL